MRPILYPALCLCKTLLYLGNMKAKIYKPAKSAMQSGERNTKLWLLEFDYADRKYVEPLMGWTGGGDTLQQLKLHFATKEEAIEYATRKNIPFYVEEPNKRKHIKKSYADNFAYKPAKPQNSAN